MKYSIIALAGITLLQHSANTSAEFTSLDGDYSDVTTVVISPTCPSGGATLPATIFTILPTSDGTAYVSSDPANLITVTNNNGVMTFDWTGFGGGVKSGGVQIGLPADQLKSVSVGGDTDSQILDGFTQLNGLDVLDDSELTATISSSETDSIKINVSGDSTLTLSTNVKVVDRNANVGGISGDSTVYLETPSYEDFYVGGDSTLSVKGNLVNGDVSGDSEVTVTGTVTGVTLSGDSELSAPSCENVSADISSSCTEGSQDVTVDVTEMAMTISGTYICGVSSGNGEDLFFSSGHKGAAVAGGTIVGALAAFLLL